MSSRSNSETAAKMPNTCLPEGVVVSIEAPRPVSTLIKADASRGQFVHRIDQVT
jgi:hypothetical protein